MKNILFSILFVVSIAANATEVAVRILTTKVVKSFIFSPSAGSYQILGDGVLLTDCDPSGIFQLTVEGDKIQLKTFEKPIGNYTTIKFYASNAEASFKIKTLLPDGKIREYDDNCEVTIATDKIQLQLLNKLELEKYIASVVESEVGKKATVEYYKLQAILSRTYLLSHINRHVLEGFQVCDDVHCQAYLYKSNDLRIESAVYATKGLVVVDNDLNLITAAFHSNCGGQTCNSEDVWSIPTTYLKSVKDTFCLRQNNAYWVRTIPMEDWKTYLQLKHKYPIDDSLKFMDATSFAQANGRAIYFTDKDLKIPLKVIRTDFKLKSTYFSIKQEGDLVKFMGRGYGHGVGLCQEGAMRMAQLNYSYKAILNYYFKDVHLVDLSALNYFKKE